MVRYPFELEVWYEEDATLNPDGSWTEGKNEWRKVGPCNVYLNGKANEIKAMNGVAFLYTYEIVMPANTMPIPIGTHVRAYDKNGRNVFDNSFISSDKPNTKGSVYTVQGFYKSGQNYESVKLWV